MVLSRLPTNIDIGRIVRIQWSVPKDQEEFKFRLISLTQEAFGNSIKPHIREDMYFTKQDLYNKNKTVLLYHPSLKGSTAMGLVIYSPEAELGNSHNIFKPIDPPPPSSRVRVIEWVEAGRFIQRIEPEEACTIYLECNLT